MKIALLAPCEESVPPTKYGGIERSVYYLAKGLILRGHDVTLFASGDSDAGVNLFPCTPRAIRKERGIESLEIRLGLRYRALANALSQIQKGQFDILHNHLGWPLFFFKDLIPYPIVTTLHNSLMPPAAHSLANDSLCAEYPEMYYVSISDAQRKPLPNLNYVATIHHGIDVDSFHFNPQPQGYLAFLGSFTPDKGAELAIKIAKKAGKRLIIAAKQDPYHMPYFKQKIEPHLDGDQIIYIGEVDHAAKVALLKNADALISPLQWDEPFGLVTIEALACGTPVVALKRGALPEVLEDGVDGFLCDTVDEMIARIPLLHKLRRSDCRKNAEKKFSIKCMTARYEAVYREILKKERGRLPFTGGILPATMPEATG